MGRAIGWIPSQQRCREFPMQASTSHTSRRQSGMSPVEIRSLTVVRRQAIRFVREVQFPPDGEGRPCGMVKVLKNELHEGVETQRRARRYPTARVIERQM